MNILFFAIDDWANVAYTYAQAMKKIGYKAKAFAMHSHSLGYPKQAETYKSFDRLEKIATSADVVVFMHSNPHFLKLPFDLSVERLAVFHGGSIYRSNPVVINSVFNPLVDISLIQTGDLLGKGAKNEKWVLTGIDTDTIKPRKIITSNVSNPKESPLVIAHFPHKSNVKGTVFIENAMRLVKKSCNKPISWYCKDEVVPYKKNLDRMAKCDIYIEAMMPTLNGKPYGEWGVTCLEAAAMGKVVVTHFLSIDRYKKEITKDCPLIVANSEKELFIQLRQLLLKSRSEIQEIQKATRAWAVKHHSLKAQGYRLKKALEI